MNKKPTLLLCLTLLLAVLIIIPAACNKQQEVSIPLPTATVQPGETPGTGSPSPSPTVYRPITEKTIIEGNNQLAFDLYKQLDADDYEANLIFSPYSVSTAMALAYAGAQGQSEKEMADILHFSHVQDSFHKAMGQLVKTVNAGSSPEGYQLSVANRVWIAKNFIPNVDFANRIKEFYGLDFATGNFADNPEGARKEINTWVEEKTDKKIRELIPPNAIKPLTRAILVNAVYFFGNWQSKFDEKQTRDENFTIAKGLKQTTPMMHQTGSFPYKETETYQALLLPYKSTGSQKLGMLILLPGKADGISDLEKTMNPHEFDRLAGSLKETRVNITLPRFKMESFISMVDTFKDLGMTAPFTEEEGLKGIKEGVYINNIFHKAFVDVNEKGTEAAAATAVVAGERSVSETMVKPPVEFKADHPFLFFIVASNDDSNNILFMGKMARPEK